MAFLSGWPQLLFTFIVHKDAVWTSHLSENVDLMDASIVYTDRGFLAFTSRYSGVDKAEADMFSDPLDTLPFLLIIHKFFDAKFGILQ